MRGREPAAARFARRIGGEEFEHSRLRCRLRDETQTDNLCYVLRWPKPSRTQSRARTELTVRFGHQVVLDQASVTILEGERVGLVGRNGSGKSTFLQIAAGVMAPDAGELNRRRDLVVGYMPQMFELDETTTVHGNILAGAQSVLDLIEEYETAPPESARSGILLEQIDHFDGWNLEHRAKSLITNLHAPDPERAVSTLSGGEKRRVALCRALLARPDFLILDEPTNHLDTGSIEWLEDFLARYSGTCLVRDARSLFSRSRRDAGGRALAREIFQLRRAITPTTCWPGPSGSRWRRCRSKSARNFSSASWPGCARRRGRAGRNRSIGWSAISRWRRRKAPEAELDVDLIIPPAPKLANRVIELREVSMELGGPEVDRQSLAQPRGRASASGSSGATGSANRHCLRSCSGKSQPTSGEVEIGARTEINYVDQNRLLLDDSKTVWEEVGEGMEYVRLGEENITLRGYLRRFLFTEERINTKIDQLSGGERSRVLLAKILKRGGNVLILDEPTNDLDLGTLRLLEEALVAFKGNVIVVSHDRYFLNRVCTAILAFEGEGAVRYAVGNYDYYLEKRATTVAGGVDPGPVAAPKAAGVTAPGYRKEKPRKLKWKEQRELEGMEDAILAAENEVVRLETLVAAPDFFVAASGGVAADRSGTGSRPKAGGVPLRKLGKAGRDRPFLHGGDQWRCAALK